MIDIFIALYLVGFLIVLGISQALDKKDNQIGKMLMVSFMSWYSLGIMIGTLILYYEERRINNERKNNI